MGAYIDAEYKGSEDPREKVIISTWKNHSQQCDYSKTVVVDMAISGQA